MDINNVAPPQGPTLGSASLGATAVDQKTTSTMTTHDGVDTHPNPETTFCRLVGIGQVAVDNLNMDVRFKNPGSPIQLHPSWTSVDQTHFSLVRNNKPCGNTRTRTRTSSCWTSEKRWKVLSMFFCGKMGCGSPRQFRVEGVQTTPGRIHQSLQILFQLEKERWLKQPQSVCDLQASYIFCLKGLFPFHTSFSPTNPSAHHSDWTAEHFFWLCSSLLARNSYSSSAVMRSPSRRPHQFKRVAAETQWCQKMQKELQHSSGGSVVHCNLFAAPPCGHTKSLPYWSRYRPEWSSQATTLTASLTVPGGHSWSSQSNTFKVRFSTISVSHTHTNTHRICIELFFEDDICYLDVDWWNNLQMNTFSQ